MDAATQGPPSDADPSLRLGPDGHAGRAAAAARQPPQSRGRDGRLRRRSTPTTSPPRSTGSSDDNSSYYVLGYYPTNERRDGRFRKIEVKVNRPGRRGPRPQGLRRAQRESPRRHRPVDVADGTPPILRDLLEQPAADPGTPADGRGRAVQGYQGPTAIDRLVVQVDGRDLTFTEKDGQVEGALDLAVVAIDGQTGSRRAALHFALTMPLQAAALPAGRGDRRPDHVELRLPPGAYQLRIGAVDTHQPARRFRALRPRRARLHGRPADDERRRPDLGAGRRRCGRPSRSPDDDLRKIAARPADRVARIPGRRGTGARGRGLRQRRRRRRTRWTSRRRSRSDDGRVVYTHEDQRSSSELGGSNGGYGHQARIPLTGNGAGALRAEGGGPVAARQGLRRVPGSAVPNRAVGRRFPCARLLASRASGRASA